IRITLKLTAEGLLQKGLPILQAYRLEKSRDGRWVVVFDRKAAPVERRPTGPSPTDGLSPEEADLVQSILQETGSSGDRFWWGQCVKRLGRESVYRALGQFREAKSLATVKNPGGLLTKIFKDIALEQGVALK